MSKIYFQGTYGAYSHLAALSVDPNAHILPCKTFDECFNMALLEPESKIIIPESNRITGNIGTGKSSVLNILKNKGIKTFDLDNVAKNLYKSNTSINKKVLDVFPSVSSTENQINTKKLGDLVFND